MWSYYSFPPFWNLSITSKAYWMKSNCLIRLAGLFIICRLTSPPLLLPVLPIHVKPGLSAAPSSSIEFPSHLFLWKVALAYNPMKSSHPWSTPPPLSQLLPLLIYITSSWLTPPTFDPYHFLSANSFYPWSMLPPLRLFSGLRSWFNLCFPGYPNFPDAWVIFICKEPWWNI